MRILLDSCMLIWMAEDSPRISPRAREKLEDGSIELVISQISYLELQLKFLSGKLPLQMTPRELINHFRDRGIAGYLRLNDEAIAFLEKLPPLHFDPFDRLLIAQALTGQMAMMTPDEKIHAYPVMTLW